MLFEGDCSGNGELVLVLLLMLKSVLKMMFCLLMVLF